MLSQNLPKDALINMRVHSSTKEFIDRAAKAIGKDRSDFMLEAAKEKAEAILMDQTHIEMDQQQWQTLRDLLDAPPKLNKKLLKLLATSAPWE
jgi:uncharacterized protein (DUF1778 family)